MLKKVFILSTILLLLSSTFFGIYNFAFEETDKIRLLKLNDNESKEKKGELSKEDGKIVLMSDKRVIAPTMDQDNKKIIFYDKSNGNVESVSLDGKMESIVFENDLKELYDIAWSPNKNFVISSFKNGKDNRFYLYSYITRKSIELKNGIDHVIWDSQGEKIIYKYYDAQSGERSLNISDPSGSDWRKLVSLGDEFKKISFIQVPQTLFVSFWSYPDAFRKTSLNKVNIMDEGEAQEIAKDKFGANYLWSPDGRSFLVSSVQEGGKNLKLEIANYDGTNYIDLNMPTLAEKCVWTKDSATIYCALPSLAAEKVIFPNDYQEGKILTNDTFWKIDVKTGKKERIVELEELDGEYDAKELFLSPNEGILFFVNRHDGKLYRIAL